jgi:hypothetical protein
MAQEKIILTDAEFHQKRFEVAKDLIAGVLSEDLLERVVEPKRRASLIYTTIMVADSLLEELGYVAKSQHGQKPGTKMHNLQELLKSGGSSQSDD